MLLPYRRKSWRLRVKILFVTFGLVLSWLLFARRRHHCLPFLASDDCLLEKRFPLAWKYIHPFHGQGGAWFIPPEWIDGEENKPQNIVDAARLASKAAISDTRRQIALSNIPLLIHQAWKSTQIDKWDFEMTSWVEQWPHYVTEPQDSPMAYFFWDDEGILAFVKEFEADFLGPFLSYFSPVERADMFRILICYRLGGIYADVDTEPLRHPATWINLPDIAPWTDEVTGVSHGFTSSPGSSPALISGEGKRARPVNLALGIEADTDPASNYYWRIGYEYPIQLTQWALASSPLHEALEKFFNNVKAQISNAEIKAASAGANVTDRAKNEIARIEPVKLTGPAAVTFSTMTWLQDRFDFRWNALTGLKDGGRAKLISDILILPITGFSPGRKQNKMGSKSIYHSDARLYHHFRGSWRHFDIGVEYGKFCRRVFRLCRDWPKSIP